MPNYKCGPLANVAGVARLAPWATASTRTDSHALDGARAKLKLKVVP